MSIAVPTPTYNPNESPVAKTEVAKAVTHPTFTCLDSSDEEEDDEIEVDDPLQMEKIHDIATDMEVTPASPGNDADIEQSSTSPNIDIEQLSEEDELQSDTDLESVSNEKEDEKENGKEKEKENEELVETAAIEPIDNQNTHKSISRPVRENRNRVTTYNDIANSIDTDKISLEVDEQYNIKRKKRSSPPKAVNPASVLNAFTRDLTSKRHLQTGFVYDTAMSYHATPNPMEIHPEDPRRIFKIFNILDQHGLLQECERINSRRATKQEILLVHNIIHYRKMRETAGNK
jgi:hypothetical protein